MRFWNWILSLFAPKQENDNGIDPHFPVSPPAAPAVNAGPVIVPIEHAGLPPGAIKVVKPSPQHMVEARKYIGMKETDSRANKIARWAWGLVGLDYDTFSGNSRAWCAVFIAIVASAGGGYQYAHTANARKQGEVKGIYYVIDWKKNGIREGMFAHLNHKGQCGVDGDNHVSFANGDCAPQDLLEMKKDANGVWQYVGGKPVPKKNAKIALLGGNQGNQVSVVDYPVFEICEVRAFMNQEVNGKLIQLPMPEPVTVSRNCSGGEKAGSTQ